MDSIKAFIMLSAAAKVPKQRNCDANGKGRKEMNVQLRSGTILIKKM